MKLAEDISQEELDVFLQEADEQLQLLDEDLVSLEKEGADADLLQEIFRAAHTLKGSSGMVGYEKMSRVAHAMEAVLDKLRNQTLNVSTTVIDALLNGLDVLKTLREDMLSEEESDTDIESVEAKLAGVGNESGGAAPVEEGEKTATAPAVAGKVHAALEQGQNVYQVKINVAPDSPWCAVRCFQVINELCPAGELLWSVPSREEIEEGKVNHSLQAILASRLENTEIEKLVGTVPDLLEVTVAPYNTEEQTGESESAEATVGEGPAEPGSTDAQKASSQKSPRTAQTVRVDVKLLDSLMNLVGEMVTERNRVKQVSQILAARYQVDEEIDMLGEASTHIMKLVNDLQGNVLKARMLTIGTVFNGFPRLIRDVAHKAGKNVEFIVEGQETELDRTIIEQIRDPLLHLLRNAVDHGIETPQERRAAGKEEKGVLHLSACQEQNHIVITVEDDGGGIDVERVKETAVKRGVISGEEVAILSEDEATNLIFAPGLSTAKKVTEVSGRGVGMDVVRNNIETLGGSVVVESKKGEGSRFIIRLPLTLATINGLLVSANNAVFIIPMISLVEVKNLRKEEIESIARKDVIRVRGGILPLLRLDAAFGMDGGDRPEYSHQTLTVVVRAGDRSAGLVVDKVMETQDTVVKSLGKYIGNIKGIAGATILGNGQVALILDTATLIREATKH
jgi:two-component system, chemotaxis family, sensor kinase CheA